MSAEIIIAGTGFMAQAYAQVLIALEKPFIAVGNSVAGVERFNECFGGQYAVPGPLSVWLENAEQVPVEAIVCVPTQHSLACVKQLLGAGVKDLLLEKPGATNLQELQELQRAVTSKNASAHIAYNRRFFSSVREVKKRIEEDGGLLSFSFDFTEREKDPMMDKFTTEIRKNWFLANSSHLVDLAFYLGGEPESLSSCVTSSLPWHPSGAVFSGSGRTDSGVMFSYHANWLSAGRWSVELCTAKYRYFLSPLEKIRRQARGLFVLEDVEFDDELDIAFKPGIYLQTSAFVNKDFRNLIALDEHVDRTEKVFSVISGER